MFADTVPDESELSEHVELLLVRNGGHVGFVAGRYPWKAEYWYEGRIVEFLTNNS
jgi:predicted alpha/beta-fold hydrolase